MKIFDQAGSKKIVVWNLGMTKIGPIYRSGSKNQITATVFRFCGSKRTIEKVEIGMLVATHFKAEI